ncbi:Uncharacterised protein [Mycobacteroides abscessus subsp. abscessus]|nr:Uncharacterised protein [Mycobacteroides abscessus subsp. abscessus]
MEKTTVMDPVFPTARSHRFRSSGMSVVAGSARSTTEMSAESPPVVF